MSSARYFDHALTECETGMRRNPRRVRVLGLFHAGAVKQGHRVASHPRQTQDEFWIGTGRVPANRCLRNRPQPKHCSASSVIAARWRSILVKY